MHKKIVILSVLVIFAITAHSQDKKIEITGKPIVTIFSNYHAGFGDASSNAGFALDRAYLGYQFSLPEGFSGRVVFDVGDPKSGDFQYVAYVKNAMLSWKKNNLNINFGMINTIAFDLQDKFGGMRYIWKSFQDQYGWAPSADLGISAGYKFASWISADVIIANGEGYKKISVDNRNRYGLGVTANPIKQLTLRAYGDIYTPKEKETQSSFALFAGYAEERFSVGAEYNNIYNLKGILDSNQSGVSLYSTFCFYDKWSAIGRYDNLFDTTQRALIGVQYAPIKQLRITPNIQMSKGDEASAQYIAYLSLEVKF